MAGRPKISTPKQPKAKKILNDYSCQNCGTLKKETEYYVSYNPIHKMGRILYCKTCIKDMISDTDGNVAMDKVKSTLQLMDRPFLYNIWKTSLEEGGVVMGVYMKNIAMSQYRNLGWKDSRILPEIEQQLNYDNASSEIKQKEAKSIFILTDEIEEKWGFGYSSDEYSYFEKKWNSLIDNYGEKTSLHIEGLKTYIRFRVKEEISTALGNVKDAKDWAALAKDSATAAKINVSQLSKSDISGGVDLLPQLFEAVESIVGIIPTLPSLKEQPYDDADLIIWSVVNYLRRLEDKPRIAYREIWNFYDQMLSESFTQQGLSPEAIELEKKKRNNVFRDLGDVYKEPIYEESDE